MVFYLNFDTFPFFKTFSSLFNQLFISSNTVSLFLKFFLSNWNFLISGNFLKSGISATGTSILEVPSSNPSLGIVPSGKAIYPHCLVSRKGFKVVGRCDVLETWNKTTRSSRRHKHMIWYRSNVYTCASDWLMCSELG